MTSQSFKRVQRARAGMSNLRLLLSIPLFVVGVFAAFKFGVAAIDVWGFQKDLEQNISDMDYTCVAAACEDDLFDQIEELMRLHNRDVKIYWDAIDWVIDDNELLVPGFTDVDLIAVKVRWNFEHRIATLR